MDPLQLLTRSSKRPNGSRNKRESLPSGGVAANPQLFGAKNAINGRDGEVAQSRKRKRGSDFLPGGESSIAGLNFFGGAPAGEQDATVESSDEEADAGGEKFGEETSGKPEEERLRPRMTEEDRRAILKSHKLKVTVIHKTGLVPTEKELKKKKKKFGKEQSQKTKIVQHSLYPQPVTDFRVLRHLYGIPQSMARNIQEQGYKTPTEVQMASLPLLLGTDEESLPDGETTPSEGSTHGHLDLLTVAPTGSGKTLAFLIPLIHAIAKSRATHQEPASSKAIVLAPTKELANQIANEGRKLAANTGISISSVRKGMTVNQSNLVEDESLIEIPNPPVKSDILVSTPMTLLNAIGDAGKTQGGLADIRHLILDEADVLLDPLFREQTLAIWNALSNPDLRVSLWSATMGSNIEELAKQVIETRSTQLSVSGKTVNQAPLVRLVVGLKDSAVPNIDHQMTYAATEQGKLMALRQLLHPSATETNGRLPLRAPFLVFTQTIERAVALHSELLYDIPPEAGGISRIAVLHSDLSDAARDKVMTRFRKGEVWVLITTDLLSRGVDFRGINGVVSYDVPNSSAAYVHRVGRTGRAGREGGVAVTLYTKEDIPYIKNVANVIAASQKQKGSKTGGVEQWLLDALPDVSKRDKQQLKKHGVEARRASKVVKGGKGTTRMRISTKSGFERRLENNKRSAAAARRDVDSV